MWGGGFRKYPVFGLVPSPHGFNFCASIFLTDSESFYKNALIQQDKAKISIY